MTDARRELIKLYHLILVLATILPTRSTGELLTNKLTSRGGMGHLI